MRYAKLFARFWWDFVVGDEWRMAVVVATVTVIGALAAAGHWADGRVIAIAVGAGVVALVCAALLATGRRRRSAA